MTTDPALLQLVESIDRRLELANTKLDMAIANMTTKNYCLQDCEVRKGAIDKRYFLGWGSAMLLMVAIIGLALKFT